MCRSKKQLLHTDRSVKLNNEGFTTYYVYYVLYISCIMYYVSEYYCVVLVNTTVLCYLYLEYSFTPTDQSPLLLSKHTMRLFYSSSDHGTKVSLPFINHEFCIQNNGFCIKDDEFLKELPVRLKYVSVKRRFMSMEVMIFPLNLMNFVLKNDDVLLKMTDFVLIMTDFISW